MTAPHPPGPVQSLYAVEGMRCAACIARIERGLPETPGIEAARVNLSARRVRVDHVPGLDEAIIIEAFKGVGFDAHPYAGEEVESAKSAETKALLKSFAVAGFATMNIMLLSVSVWSGAGGITRELFHWLSAIIAIPTVLYSGQPFFRSALAALRNRRTNMDVPISIGVILATAMSLYETVTGGAHAYFDGAVMLLFFLLAGRVADSMMRARAEGAVTALMKRLPREATVIENGQQVRRPVAMLLPGDRVLVAAGERIPADGTLVEGHSEVDRSLVTGESLPETVDAGAELLAGTVNLAAPVTMEVTAPAEASAISEIAKLMERASESRSDYVRIADRAARLYAPAVHTLALAAFVGWMIAGVGWHQSMLIAIAVLIITCPCALGLAVPVAQVVAANALMKAGILVREGSALERLAEADEVLFDKTGTITLGRIDAEGLPTSPERRAVLAALAGASRHPLSRAVTCALEGTAQADVDGLAEQPGLGIEASVEGTRWRFGRPDWVGTEAPDHATKALAAFGPVGGEASIILFDDHLRPDAAAAVAELEALGLPASMVSGDHEAAVAAVANAVGIEGRARVSPEEKAARIEQAEADGRKLLMVGDGLNDGPALKRAHVSMAPSSASDVGQTAADYLFFGESLSPVPRAVRAARRTMKVIRQNFGMAITYNIVAVPLALMGKVTPLVAAIAMSGSSLIVVANSLRLARAAK
ncbi:heavy metal translocating P-type ATPase [Sphingomicrobium nitratireducens]|uniref:heavy metal translocating P-type ATPase n=1 Tax=Sphingomicrobium nitratireducens TaxID=2964666 RepID=UPI002240694C|nr:heavy metal translocating P-type ATPase [Sphingomicrobium nitratireducens]